MLRLFWYIGRNNNHMSIYYYLEIRPVGKELQDMETRKGDWSECEPRHKKLLAELFPSRISKSWARQRLGLSHLLFPKEQ